MAKNTLTLLGDGGTVTVSIAGNPNVDVDITGLTSTFDIVAGSGTNATLIQTDATGDAPGSVFDLTASQGGTIKIGAGIAAAGDTINATIQTGGQYVAEGATSGKLNGTIAFGAGGGKFVIGASPGTAPSSLKVTSTHIAGFANGLDVINDESINLQHITSYVVSGNGSGSPTGLQTITISDAIDGNLTFITASTSFATGTYSTSSGPLHFAVDSTNGGTDISVACFVSGTRIATPTGQTTVEALEIGDLVETRLNGKSAFQPVIWIGHCVMDITSNRDRTDAYPVRIRAGAFADQIPVRDLLVTSDHCIFVDGRLIPARMLVNGGSIVVDTDITRYEYFHIELERHAILVAEGLETESYLDTGNRGIFANTVVQPLHRDLAIDPIHKNWERDAVAPLAVDRETVQPIWERLAQRARERGQSSGNATCLVDQPDLRLVTQAGQEIAPAMCDGSFYGFLIPAGTNMLRLTSRASRPADTIGPFVDDRRKLGVLVGKIGICNGRHRVITDRHLTHPALDGWHAPEAGMSGRWTNGNAILPIDLSGLDGEPLFVDIDIIHAGPYLENIEPAPEYGSRVA